MWQEILGILAKNVENCFIDKAVLTTPTEDILGSIDSCLGPKKYFQKVYAVADFTVSEKG